MIFILLSHAWSTTITKRMEFVQTEAGRSQTMKGKGKCNNISPETGVSTWVGWAWRGKQKGRNDVAVNGESLIRKHYHGGGGIRPDTSLHTPTTSSPIDSIQCGRTPGWTGKSKCVLKKEIVLDSIHNSEINASILFSAIQPTSALLLAVHCLVAA